MFDTKRNPHVLRGRKEQEELAKIGQQPGSATEKEAKPVEKGVELIAEDKPKPQEAWVPMNSVPVTNDIMKKLLAVGR